MERTNQKKDNSENKEKDNNNSEKEKLKKDTSEQEIQKNETSGKEPEKVNAVNTVWSTRSSQHGQRSNGQHGPVNMVQIPTWSGGGGWGVGQFSYILGCAR